MICMAWLLHRLIECLETQGFYGEVRQDLISSSKP